MILPHLITIAKLEDSRGIFLPAYDAESSPVAGLHQNWILQNVSESAPGALRGMHFQAEDSQSKLVTVLKGSIQDVVLDVRPGSGTFGKPFSFVLSATGANQLFVPRGFAHGFLVLGNEPALISYLADAPYRPESERIWSWQSAVFGNLWISKPLVISPRDANAPLFQD